MMTEPRYAFTACSTDYADMDPESKEMFRQLVNAAGDRMRKENSMSWSMSFEGDREAVEEQFKKQHDQSKSWGMIEAELVDIGDASNFVQLMAMKYGRVKGSASGHWNTQYNVPPSESNPGGTVSSFGRISITVDAAPKEASNGNH